MVQKDQFWRNRSLKEMTTEEWESLCDGCGRCCLNKIEDEDSGEYFYTRVACSLLDLKSCRCEAYENRMKLIPDCRALTPETVSDIPWLPSTCAYRLLSEGKELPWWHPLVSGRPDTVREAGISLHDRPVVKKNVHSKRLAKYVVDWVQI